jgi:hypothetical protein
MFDAVRPQKQKLSDGRKDYIHALERQLKELWSQYMKCLDEHGLNDTARSLRERYFNIYRAYRHNKKWRELMNS